MSATAGSPATSAGRRGLTFTPMSRLLPLLGLLSLLAAPLPAAEAPATLLAQPDKEIVADTLLKDGKAAEWKIAKGKWERTAEGLRVEELLAKPAPAK